MKTKSITGAPVTANSAQLFERSPSVGLAGSILGTGLCPDALASGTEPLPAFSLANCAPEQGDQVARVVFSNYLEKQKNFFVNAGRGRQLGSIRNDWLALLLEMM